jgi:hypothetical protein
MPNGVAERLNRTLVAMAKAMLFYSGLPQVFWGFAIEAACYIRNRLPIGPGKITPEQAFTGGMPGVNHLRVFGCLAYVLRPQELRLKLDANSIKTIFVGYAESTRQYRVYDPVRKAITRSHNVEFFENERLEFEWDEQVPGHLVEFRDVDGDSDESTSGITIPILTPPESPVISPENPKDPGMESAGTLEGMAGARVGTPKASFPLMDKDTTLLPTEGNNHTLSEGGESNSTQPATNSPDLNERGRKPDIVPEMASSNRPVRTRKSPQRLIETIGFSVLERPNIPLSFQAAIEDPIHSAEWKAAIKDQLDMLVAKRTFKPAKLPPGRRKIKCRWVFSVKYTSNGLIDKFKARLVAKGCSQTYGIEYLDSYSPTIRMDSLRALLAIAAANNWPLRQVDVISAYLAGHLDEEVYMEPPEGLDMPLGTTLRLLKALYGLKQSGRVWYHRIQEFLESQGLYRTDSDWCVFVNAERTLFVGVYVDDLVITGPSLSAINSLIAAIAVAFPVKDLGEIDFCLGLHVVRDDKAKTLTIDQSQYVENMLRAYRMEDCVPVATPIDGYESTAPALPNEPRADSQLYQQAVGSLQYASVGTRMDITYAVGRLSQHLMDPTIRHWNAVLRVFRYLKGTINYYIVFRIGASDAVLIGFADADYASAIDRVSISAYVFTFNGAAISWSSKRQRTISTSTVEAEYVALCTGAKQAVWLRALFIELGQSQFLAKNPGKSVLIYGDNQGALALVENPENHARTKHIDVQYHYIRYLVGNGSVSIAYCPTDRMAADVLTKPLAKIKHMRCLETTFGMEKDTEMGVN